MNSIEFSNEIPPIYHKLKDQFGVSWNEGIIIANYPKIHCKFDIPPEKLVHEKVHLDRQMKIGLDLWWELYLGKESYRLEEEVLAYQAEYQFLKRYIKDRELLYSLVREMAAHLSGQMYGNILTATEAIKLIRG